jgi:threonine aldolase
MTLKVIDLRSDTVTRPGQAMRQAMATAEVDDDVIDIDPTVARLQAMIAERLGKEAALYVPSGTMANQIAVRVHCRPGDEILMESECHLFHYEQAGFAQLGGCSARTLVGDHGVIVPEQLEGMIRPDDEHFARTRLVCLENTHNRGGGRVLPFAGVEQICHWAAQHGLARHLDGARLFNAAVASGIAPDRWAAGFDTVSVCFSKGLGAPVGSAICGTREMIADARRQRKLLGGGMRQAGIIAAGAIYALQHHVERLADDHAHAQQLAEAVRQSPGICLEPAKVDTNIVIFRVEAAGSDAEAFCLALREQGVAMLPFGPRHVRAVTHLDVDPQQVAQACEAVRRVADQL